MGARNSTIVHAGTAAERAQPWPEAAASLMRRHAAGLIVALLFASALVVPRWWLLTTSADDGVRVPISPYAAGAIGFDETLYMPSIRQAYDGALPVSDPYLANHQDGSAQRSAFSQQAIGILGRVVGDPYLALTIVITLFAVLALVGLYVMGYTLTRSRLAALALIPVVLLAIHVLNHAEGILPLRHRDILAPLLELEPQRQMHPWARFPAPILVLAPFFGAVVALPKAVETGRGRWVALATLCLAGLIYTYVYYWTAMALALAAWLAFLWVSDHRTEALRLIRIGALATLAALPELIVLGWAVLDLPEDARGRLGQGTFGLDTSQHMVTLQRLVFGAPFLLALLGGPARNGLYAALFLAPLALGPLTGVVPQEWHYSTQVWGVFALPAVIAGGSNLAQMIGRDDWARLAAGGALAVVLLASGYVLAMQARALAETEDGYVISEDEDAALDWIRANLDGETVVSTSITTNLLLAGLTPSSQYWADGGFTHAEDEELIERILRAQAAYGYTEEAAFSRLDVSGEFEGFPVNDANADSREQERLLEDYLAFFTFAFEISDAPAFMDIVDAWRPRYRELLTTTNPLSAFPADYLYCGERERYFETGASSPGTWVAPAFESGDVAIYALADASAPEAVEFAGC